MESEVRPATASASQAPCVIAKATVRAIRTPKKRVLTKAAWVDSPPWRSTTSMKQIDVEITPSRIVDPVGIARADDVVALDSKSNVAF